MLDAGAAASAAQNFAPVFINNANVVNAPRTDIELRMHAEAVSVRYHVDHTHCEPHRFLPSSAEAGVNAPLGPPAGPPPKRRRVVDVQCPLTSIYKRVRLQRFRFDCTDVPEAMCVW
jgi:hypothetical protein